MAEQFRAPLQVDKLIGREERKTMSSLFELMSRHQEEYQSMQIHLSNRNERLDKKLQKALAENHTLKTRVRHLKSKADATIELMALKKEFSDLYDQNGSLAEENVDLKNKLEDTEARLQAVQTQMITITALLSSACSTFVKGGANDTNSK